MKKTFLHSFMLFFVFQGITGQVNSLFDEIESEKTEIELLPNSMLFTQRWLWGEKGLMRKTNLLPLSIENREREMKIRRKMLISHQVIGYATLAGMIAQGVLGVKLYNGHSQYEDAHEIIGNFTTASYFTGAGLSLFAPPPLISVKDKGLTSIKAHKWLATVHFSAMIATNVFADSNKEYHRAASYTLFGSYALAIISFKF
ncbi:hypothetical protein OAM55_01620 [Flavobacteriaceae bacterium]|jgi:hypothetical protein|nr:hypothetical protein [Flavobacteriaceae bacterium]